MPTVSMKYFHDHVSTSQFNNQADLAGTLEVHGKRTLIESSDMSPLTVRLFNVKSGLDRAADCAQRLAMRPFPREFVQQGLYNGPTNQTALYGTQAPSGSMEYVQSYLTPRNGWRADFSPAVAGMCDCRFEYPDANTVRIIREDTKVHTFNLHSGVYDFFVNLDSAFDRIRLELNSIYFDGRKELDSAQSKGNAYWAQYLNPNNKVVKSLTSNGCNSIVAILTGPLSASLDQSTGKYRNRLIHDGDLELRIDPHTGIVYLPDDPLASAPTFTTELLPFLSKVFSDVQILFHDLYAQIIVDITTKNKIPII